MAGKTGLIVSLLHDHFVHVPIRLAVSQRKCIDPEKELWRDVTEATGQPLLMRERRKHPRTKKNTSPKLAAEAGVV
jgi:6-phosphofructokinase 1